LLPRLPPDLLFSEKSMDVLELKLCICGIHDHVLNPFGTAPILSAIKLHMKDKNRPCNKCGIDKMYLAVLLALSRAHLTNDDSLLHKCVFGNDGNDVTEEESNALMLRMIMNDITELVENPGGTDDHTEDDDE
jgi:hypothetical protein